MNEFEICCLVDNNGDYALGKDEQAAREAYEEQIQPLADCDGFRIIKLNLRAKLPEVVSASVAADGDAVAVSV